MQPEICNLRIIFPSFGSAVMLAVAMFDESILFFFFFHDRRTPSSSEFSLRVCEGNLLKNDILIQKNDRMNFP